MILKKYSKKTAASQVKKGLKITEWLLCLWFSLAISFFSFLYVTRKDGIFSRREQILLFVLWLGLLFFFRIGLFNRFRPVYRYKEIFLFSILVSVYVVLRFSDSLHPFLYTVKNLEITVSNLQDQATIEMDWAYWATEPQQMTSDPNDYLHSQDMRLNQLVTDDQWSFSETGALITRSNDAKIHVNGDFVRLFVPVFHFKAENGSGTLSVRYNGTSKDYNLSSDEHESMLILGYTSSNLSRVISSSVFLFALAGFLVCFSFFIQWIYDQKIIRKEWWIAIASFGLPIIILLGICAIQKIYPFGEKTFFVVDMNQMYSDMLAYLKTIFSERNNLIYTFSKNLGGDMLTPYAFYLGNPLNFVICLFPAADLPKVISFLILLQFGVCGFTSHLYFRRRLPASFATLLFSTSYALMAYNLVNAENMHFIAGAIWLPLTALGIELIVERNQPFLYIGSLWIILLINFYFGYMICIFSLFFFLFSILSAPDRKSCNKKTFFHFFSGSILSAAGASCLLLPSFLKLMEGTKEFNLSKLSLSANFFLPDLFSKLFTGAHNEFEIDSGLPIIFCGIFINILAFLFYLNNRISAKEKLLVFCLSAILVVSFVISGVNLVWHGLNKPVWWPYRYAFIFSFIWILTAYRCFLQMKGIRFRSILISIAGFVSISVFVMNRNFPYLSWDKILMDNLLLFILCLLLFIFQREKPFKTKIFSKDLAFLLIMTLNIINLTENADQIWEVNYADSVKTHEYRDFINAVSPVIRRIKAEDQSFYRTEKTFQRGLNDALQFSYNGLTHYSSTTNRKVFDFLSRLGFAHYHYWTRYGQGSTAAMDSLLGIKYIASDQKAITKNFDPWFSENGINVFKNPNALSLGFAASEQIQSCSIPPEIDLFEVQNRIFHCLTGTDSEALFSTTQTIWYSQNNQNGQIDPSALSAETSGISAEPYSEWTIKIEKSDPLYVHIPNAPDVTSVYEVYLNDQFIIRNESVIESGILPLGRFSPGETIRLRLKWLGPPYPVQDALFRYENQSILEKYTVFLNQNPVSLQKQSSSHLKGTFSIPDKNHVLFLSIPFERDWQVFVDGVKVQTTEALDAMISMKAEPGSHTLEMVYIPVGLIAGSGLSILSLIVFIFWFYQETRKQPARS